MQQYFPVSYYVNKTRLLLQDLIQPYRYSDDGIILCLNTGLHEMQRLRPDIFLDLKYQRPLAKGDLGDGIPQDYNSADETPLVPLPARYESTLTWFMSGYAQVFDVTDTTDQRAQAFMAKFSQHLLQLGAA